MSKNYGVIFLIVIGEKINGAIPSTAAAINEKDAEYIRLLAVAQTEAGANYLDVCAGTEPEREYDTLAWLLEIVQSVSELPICIDSPNQHMFRSVLPLIQKPGIINSVSGEGDKCEVLLPLLRDNPDWQVIALCCDSNGVAEKADDKVRIAFELIERAGEYGITPDRMHIDPLVLALSAVNSAALAFCEAIMRIKEKYPTVKVTAALSNVSFGMPARGLINSNFLTMAMIHGLDSVIADPTNRGFTGSFLATEALLGRDKFCRNYNKAYRAGKIGPVNK